MALESYNILTLSDFLYFWGVVFMVATTLVAIFKHEDVVKEKVDYDDEDAEGEEILGVVDTYKQLVILSIQILAGRRCNQKWVNEV